MLSQFTHRDIMMSIHLVSSSPLPGAQLLKPNPLPSLCLFVLVANEMTCDWGSWGLSWGLPWVGSQRWRPSPGDHRLRRGPLSTPPARKLLEAPRETLDPKSAPSSIFSLGLRDECGNGCREAQGRSASPLTSSSEAAPPEGSGHLAFCDLFLPPRNWGGAQKL